MGAREAGSARLRAVIYLAKRDAPGAGGVFIARICDRLAGDGGIVLHHPNRQLAQPCAVLPYGAYLLAEYHAAGGIPAGLQGGESFRILRHIR